MCPILAEQAVEKSWQDTPEDMQIKTTGNLHSLFLRLKENGVKIAICTSDSREGTEQFLARENLSKYLPDEFPFIKDERIGVEYP